MTVPHGLLGKAYAATMFIVVAIVASGLILLIGSAPLWVIVHIFVGIVIAIIIFISWLSRQRTGEG